MKCKGEHNIKEVPLINLLRSEDLRKLNERFGTHYNPQKVEATAKIIDQIRLDEIDRLMKKRPERGGYGA